MNDEEARQTQDDFSSEACEQAWEQVSQITEALVKGLRDDEAYAAGLDKFIKHMDAGRTMGDMKGFTQTELDGLHTMAHHFYCAGALKEAKAIYNVLIYLNHFESKYYVSLAACEHQEKRYSEALVIYGAGFFLDSKNPKIPFNSALCHLALNHVDLAKAALEHADRLLVHPIRAELKDTYDRVLKLFKVVQQRELRTAKAKTADTASAAQQKDAQMADA